MRNSIMRNGIIALALAGCAAADGTASVTAAVAGPGGITVTPRSDPGQLAVSWSAVSAASSYQVFQSLGGGSPTLAATIFDSGGGPPPTSFIATDLALGATYCYSVIAALPGGASDSSAIACGSTAGAGAFRHRMASALTAVLENPTVLGGPAATFIGGTWTFRNAGGAVYFPVPASAGETLGGFTVWLAKGSGAGCTVTASLFERDPSTRVATELLQASNSGTAPSGVALGASGLQHAVPDGVSYYIRIADGACGANADSFTDAMVSWR